MLVERGFRILADAGGRWQEDRLPWSAVGFLLRRAPGDVAQANRLLMAWTREQNRRVRSQQYGTGFRDDAPARYESGAQPTPSLYNAFAAPALALLFTRFGADLAPDVRAACLETMKAGLFEFLSRDLPLNSNNQSFGMDAGLIVYGTLLDLPAIVKKGAYRLLHHLEIGAYLSPMEEYNSPTYGAADLDLLAGILAVTDRRDIRLAARVLIERLVLVAACHYHPPTRELAPPHYRAYHSTLSRYPGGMGTAIFKMTGDRALVEGPSCGTHDVFMNFVFAAHDLRISAPMEKLFLRKTWPFEARAVRSYGFPDIPGKVNPWPEVTSFYPDHAARSARMLAAAPVRFDAARPRSVATAYMTGVYALGTFSTEPLTSPYGYGRFHRRGFQFYYRPREETETWPMRCGFLAFPNAGDKDDPDNVVNCLSVAGQHRNVALALYRMSPGRASACEVFCALQAADGRESFHDAGGPLRRGQPARGPIFVQDGRCYLAFLRAGEARLFVEDRDPKQTGYPFYQDKAVPAVVLSCYRGPRRRFDGKTVFEGGLALVMGDAGEYGSFERFRARWSRAELTRRTGAGGIELSLTGVAPAMRLRSRGNMNGHPEFFVSGRQQTADALESPFARQSHRGEPVEVGPFRVESSGRPVTAYAAPDGSGCVVLQPLPIPVDITVRSPMGTVRAKGLPLGRIELTDSPARLLVEACAPPARLLVTGQMSQWKRTLRYG